ncbi:MAG: MauE/DoxX family redox-associated membrane protein [Verrucomicrobiota bacterium]
MRRFAVIAARVLLAAVFILAAVPKILAPHDFALAVLRYQMIPYPLVNLMAIFLPWVELVAGAAILVSRFSRGAVLILAALLAVFAVAISVNLLRGVDMACGCFTVDPDAERIGWWNVVRNLALIGAAFLAWRRTDGKSCLRSPLEAVDRCPPL